MKVVGYIRVSTGVQAEEGLGLEIQERAIRKWARGQGHRIVELQRDEGVSGSNGLDTRVGLVEAIAALRGGRAGGLVVYRLDRLARDLVLQEHLLAEVWRMGAEVFTTSAAETSYLSDDPDDPSRKLIRQVLGAVAEYERSMISLRLRSGRKRKAEKGGYAHGRPPYGFRARGGELVPDAYEQEVIDRIAELKRGGIGSLRAIASALTAEGYRPRGGGAWHPQTLSGIISRLTPADLRRGGPPLRNVEQKEALRLARHESP